MNSIRTFKQSPGNFGVSLARIIVHGVGPMTTLLHKELNSNGQTTQAHCYAIGNSRRLEIGYMFRRMMPSPSGLSLLFLGLRWGTAKCSTILANLIALSSRYL
jgi:hypothetical protein